MQHVHAEAQRAEGGVELGAHEIGEGEAASGRAYDQRTTLGEAGDRLAGEIIVGEQPAAVRLAGKRRAKERAEHGVGVRFGPDAPRRTR